MKVKIKKSRLKSHIGKTIMLGPVMKKGGKTYYFNPIFFEEREYFPELNYVTNVLSLKEVSLIKPKTWVFDVEQIIGHGDDERVVETVNTEFIKKLDEFFDTLDVEFFDKYDPEKTDMTRTKSAFLMGFDPDATEGESDGFFRCFGEPNTIIRCMTKLFIDYPHALDIFKNAVAGALTHRIFGQSFGIGVELKQVDEEKADDLERNSRNRGNPDVN